MTIIAGLDVATRSGLAVFDGVRPIFSEGFVAEGDDLGEVASAFREWLIDRIRRFEIQRIAIENPIPPMQFGRRTTIEKSHLLGTTEISETKGGGTQWWATLRLIGLWAHATQIAQKLGCERRPVNVKTWRSIFLPGMGPPKQHRDKSKWWKQASIERCHALGWDIADKDASEAAGIAYYDQHMLGMWDRQGRLWG